MPDQSGPDGPIQRAEDTRPEPAPRRAEPEPVDGRRRLLASLVKPGKGQLIAAAMLFVVGMAGVMQIRSNTQDSTYATARREDLVVLLDGLNEQQQRLEREQADLERTRSQLQSGADSQRVARAEARQRVDDLSILAGTAPATGPGIRMTISDPAHKLTADVLLDAVEEMRDAGAEVIEVNDSVRVVASTSFDHDAAGLVVDGKRVAAPYVLDLIGDPHSLEEAARFRGGLVSEITGPRIGGTVSIEQLDDLEIASLHSPAENQYARPASTAPTPR
jgi:uncharacterized protein YlxW (UPF0749 family)